MLFMLIGCVPAILIRYVILKKPLSLMVSIAIAALTLVALTVVNELLSGAGTFKLGSGTVGAVPVLTFFILYRKGKSKPGEKEVSERDRDYVICGACGFEQWKGYENCQKCGVKFSH